MARQKVLEVLYEGIEDKSKLTASKRVVAIRSIEHSAVMVGADGSEISCDFLAGADGVRSLVRREIESRSQRTKTPLSGKFPTDPQISRPLPNSIGKHSMQHTLASMEYPILSRTLDPVEPSRCMIRMRLC